MTTEVLSRPEASAAVEASGWRLIYASYAVSVPVAGMREALAIAGAAVAACGADGDHLSIDLRPDRVELDLHLPGAVGVTARDAELAAAITARVRAMGLEIAPPTGPGRPVQLFEVAIDALDIPRIRPFWKAVLGYVDEPGAGPVGAIVDPAGRLPSVWFQQMDVPRPQRNRIHFDLDVAHDDAERRLRAAIDAGGVLVSADRARAFWVLADAEGNEICICTWQDRD